MNFAGLPADVVTNLTPELQTYLSIASSRRKRIGRLTPNGNCNAFICSISPWHASVSPDEVSITPRPPARETADASWVRAIQPIGACTIGYLAPVWARTRFMAVHCCKEKVEAVGMRRTVWHANSH